MGLLDNFWGPNKYPGLLSDDMYRMYQQQQVSQFLAQAGDFLTRRAQGNYSGGFGGGGQGNQGAGGLLQMMQMQQYGQQQQGRQEKKERERHQYGARDMLSSGALASARHPAPAGYSPGRGLLDREYEGLLGQAYPEAVGKARVAQAYPTPQQPPTGFERTTAGLGPISGGPADIGYLGRKATATRAPTERQSKIKELKARGLSQSQAEDIASGRVRVSTDPVTGAIRLVNVATERMTQPRGQPDIPKKTRAEMAGQVQSIEGLLAKMPSLQKAIEKGVGFIPAAKEFGGKVLGQLPTGSVDIPGIGEIGTGEAAVDPEVVRARTQLRIFREDVIAAFRKSGRVPVQEQQRILQFVDKLGILNSAPDAKLAFQQLETELRRIRDTYDVQLGGGAPAPSNPYSNMSDQEVLELLKQQGYDIGG